MGIKGRHALRTVGDKQAELSQTLHNRNNEFRVGHEYMLQMTE